MNQLGKYRILGEPLGSGANATVYRAEDLELGRIVALKVLSPRLVSNDTALVRFRLEARALAGLVHPHIAFLWEMGEDNGRVFLAMRFVDGPALDQRLTEHGALSWPQALTCVEQIGGALDWAHARGLVHRDVKPANIVLSESEGAVLTDFGLVKALQGAGLTMTGDILGTPAYIPPEIWLGQAVGPAVDLYGLACVLGEMLTGQVLFPGETPPAVMTRHVLSGPVWPERFASAGELVRALRQTSGPAAAIAADTSSSPTTTRELIEAEPTPSNPAGILWVHIPAGEFLYGEKKKHVKIAKPYQIGKFPVTNAQYQRFADAIPDQPVPVDWDSMKRAYPPDKAHHPVVNVSWDDAQAFCEWARCRLLTEMEWEKAARGADGRSYPWGEDWVPGKYCNSVEADIGGTTPVDEFGEGESPYHVWDMSGNVWEWTATEQDDENCIIRGGSWVDDAESCRADDGLPFNPGQHDVDLGFRCAR